ncbi:glyoxylate/hydroxypyruvate reductase A [Kaistia algarum]|uniref:2-hydroxyacid dehydrogenase n=1 Tax=Kaistia algarum TaxID=2083279 RepID=UPI000CE8C0ED|nr:glyoxylate/hydroxypyruvate reductase A [Kaistia algarum]MCX5516641.1 glyoxylate/hydroxypyruvate reductase A [Kaistia algarum]PPE77270.1 glyoxylate/hydroxypyruvate reductase A [Kaistia algarum]
MTGSNKLPGVLIASGPWQAEPWADPFRRHQPQRPLMIWPDVPDPGAVHYVLAWKPPSEAFRDLPNLRAIFSLGAGVDHIVHVPDLPKVPVTRLVDGDLAQRMNEWVVLQVLLHHRQHLAYARQQAASLWREIAQPAAPEVRVGIMGYGELGRAAVSVLRPLGFNLAAWSRTPKDDADIQTYSGQDGLTPFLARTDILVVLLPLTDETRGILNRSLFERLARNGPLGGGVVINAGRGGLQVEADLIQALDAGYLVGASLDVFEPEPLPSSSPLWLHPKVVMTPHVAATSEADIQADVIFRAIRDFEAGQPLRNVVDVSRQY